MGCGTTTVKISFIIFNVILAVISISALIWLSFNTDSYSTEFAIGTYILLVLLIAFSVLGILGSLRESICMVGVCAVFLFLLLILQTVASCLEILDQEPDNGLKVVSDAWDANKMDDLQQKLACCGKDSAQDYVLLDKPLPASCYANLELNVPNKLFLDGCSRKARDSDDNKQTNLIIVSCVLLGFELIGLILAILLFINLRNQQRRMNF